MKNSLSLRVSKSSFHFPATDSSWAIFFLPYQWWTIAPHQHKLTTNTTRTTNPSSSKRWIILFVLTMTKTNRLDEDERFVFVSSLLLSRWIRRFVFQMMKNSLSKRNFCCLSYVSHWIMSVRLYCPSLMEEEEDGLAGANHQKMKWGFWNPKGKK